MGADQNSQRRQLTSAELACLGFIDHEIEIDELLKTCTIQAPEGFLGAHSPVRVKDIEIRITGWHKLRKSKWVRTKSMFGHEHKSLRVLRSPLEDLIALAGLSGFVFSSDTSGQMDVYGHPMTVFNLESGGQAIMVELWYAECEVSAVVIGQALVEGSESRRLLTDNLAAFHIEGYRDLTECFPSSIELDEELRMFKLAAPGGELHNSTFEYLRFIEFSVEGWSDVRLEYADTPAGCLPIGRQRSGAMVPVGRITDLTEVSVEGVIVSKDRSVLFNIGSNEGDYLLKFNGAEHDVRAFFFNEYQKCWD